jgi:hypothetical protein
MSSRLPQNMPLPAMQNTWATAIEPVLSLPPNQGALLKGIALKSGTNVINHKLAKQQQGWILVDQDAAASIYRSAPFNNLTLTLTSSAACNVSLWVF